MKNKIISYLVFLFLVSNCGYTPVLTQKDYAFQISKIEKIGNKKVNKIIEKQLSNLTEENQIEESNKSKTSYNLELKSILIKETISKDSKGDPKIFKIQINTDIKITNKNGASEIKKEINKQINYNNLDDKFELSRYEDTLIENLSQVIGDRIISILSNL